MRVPSCLQTGCLTYARTVGHFLFVVVMFTVFGAFLSCPTPAHADTTISIPADWPGGNVITVPGGETLTILAAAGSPTNPTVIQVAGTVKIVGHSGTISNLYITSAAATALTIENLNISAPTGSNMNDSKPAVALVSGSTLTVEGANTLKRDAKVAGIHVPDPNTLIIEGTGSLIITANAASGTYAGGAGIGGNGGGFSPALGDGTPGETAGAITIQGTVTIEAYGGDVASMPDHGGMSAGIGGGGGSGSASGQVGNKGGHGGGGGTFAINGGSVKADIGGGDAGQCPGGGPGSQGAGATVTITRIS